MSGSRGAPGDVPGNDGQPPGRSPSGPPQGAAAPGQGPGGTGPRGDTPNDPTRGGTTMTSARPVDPYGQDAQHYHPPQAYPQPQQGPPPPQSPPPSASQSPGTQGSGVRVARTGARTVPRTRKARLRVAKADPWSVMKVSFLLSIALGICTIIAVSVLWMVMDAMGVFSTIGETITEATETDSESGFDLEAFLSLPRVLIFTSVIAVIDVVLATALATLGAFMYNLSAGFVGGVEVTLAEDE
ncbi:DUF3566 domain-containing protein [Streptomyces radicis]